MDVRQSLFFMLRKVRSQLVVEHFVKQFQNWLFTIASYLLLITFLARFIVIVNLSFYLLIGTIGFTLLYVYVSWRKSPQLRMAAHIYDQYVKEERTSTALAIAHEEGLIYELQRKDAIHHMRAMEQRVLKRRKKYMYPKSLILSLCFFSFTALMLLFPNEKIVTANIQKKEIEMIRNTKKELKEEMVNNNNPITKKSLSTVVKELEQMKKAEEALKELIKQREQLALKKMQITEDKTKINEHINQLKSVELKSLAEALEANNKDEITNETASLKENVNNLTSEQKELLAKMIDKNSEALTENMDELAKHLQSLADSNSKLEQVTEAESTLQNKINHFQASMLANGIQPSSQLMAATQLAETGQQSSGNEDGQTLNEQTPNGQSNGTKNNQQSGAGKQPSNEGSGGKNGSTSGVGGTDSNSSANVSGAGTGQGARDLMIPEMIDGKKNIETDSGFLNKGNSVEQTEGNGPIVKGTIRPYEEVYQQYEESYREGADRMQLPAELQIIVKDYFSKIKPDQE